MKKTILGMGMVLTLSGAVWAQTAGTSASGSAKNNTSIKKDGSAVSIASGTQIAAELQKSLNVEKAKVGDEIVLKATKSIKQNGQVVVAKGSKLIGRVTEVQQRAKGEAGSKIGVLFDTLQQGGTSMPITASILSVTSVASRASVNDDSAYADMNASSTTSARTSSQKSGGGLLGGVTNTVGGVVNTTTSTVGGVAGAATDTVGGVTNTAGETVGATTGAVGGTIRGLTISQSSDASASGGSTLSLTGGNLKLDKGTTFNLALSESASVGGDTMKKPGN